MFLIYLFFLHWLADGPLQSREMGRRKSESVVYLAGHVLIQYLTFVLGLMAAHYYGLLPFVKNDYEARVMVQGIALSNAAIHGLVDAIMWKGYKLSVVLRKPKHLFGRPTQGDKPVFKFWEDPMFFHTIMTDQFFHYSTLVLVFEFIKLNLGY